MAMDKVIKNAQSKRSLIEPAEVLLSDVLQELKVVRSAISDIGLIATQLDAVQTALRTETVNRALSERLLKDANLQLEQQSATNDALEVTVRGHLQTISHLTSVIAERERELRLARAHPAWRAAQAWAKAKKVLARKRRKALIDLGLHRRVLPVSTSGGMPTSHIISRSVVGPLPLLLRRAEEISLELQARCPSAGKN